MCSCRKAESAGETGSCSPDEKPEGFAVWFPHSAATKEEKQTSLCVAQHRLREGFLSPFSAV